MNNNGFEAICKQASDNKWCWTIYCSTCAHLDFKRALWGLVIGETDRHAWLRDLTPTEQEIVMQICHDANLAEIARTCKFPDWLGYLGLVMHHFQQPSPAYLRLTQHWAAQLADMMPADSDISHKLEDITAGHGRLEIKDLELCESALYRQQQSRLWYD